MRVITIKEVIHRTAKQFNMPVEEVVSKNVNRQVVLVRHIGMYIARKLTYKSLRVISNAFGMIHAGSVAHAVNHVEVLMAKNPIIEADVKAILKNLNPEENENAGKELPNT